MVTRSICRYPLLEFFHGLAERQPPVASLIASNGETSLVVLPQPPQHGVRVDFAEMSAVAQVDMGLELGAQFARHGVKEHGADTHNGRSGAFAHGFQIQHYMMHFSLLS
ncbi:hypothetical protein D3C79_914550 [compost metagenome]